NLDINPPVVDVPLDEEYAEGEEGEVPPDVLLDVRGLLGAGDGVVADLDLVRLGLAVRHARGYQPARGQVALAEAEQVDRERQPAVRLPSGEVHARLLRVMIDERPLGRAGHLHAGAVGRVYRDLLVDRLGMQDDRLAGPRHLVAAPFAYVPQRLDAVE